MEKTSTHVHTDAWYLVPRMIPGTGSRIENTAQNDIAPHRTALKGKARHRTAPRGAALLS